MYTLALPLSLVLVKLAFSNRIQCIWTSACMYSLQGHRETSRERESKAYALSQDHKWLKSYSSCKQASMCSLSSFTTTRLHVHPNASLQLDHLVRKREMLHRSLSLASPSTLLNLLNFTEISLQSILSSYSTILEPKQTTKSLFLSFIIIGIYVSFIHSGCGSSLSSEPQNR